MKSTWVESRDLSFIVHLQTFNVRPLGLFQNAKRARFASFTILYFLRGNSVHDFIDEDECKVHYAAFNTAVNLAMSFRPNAWLGSQKLTSNQLLGYSPFPLAITTSAYPWVVRFPVRFLKKNQHFLGISCYECSSRKHHYTLLG